MSFSSDRVLFKYSMIDESVPKSEFMRIYAVGTHKTAQNNI